MERSDINVDSEGNTVLHLAAKLAPDHELVQISHHAFWMHYELRRFSEAKKLVSPLVRGLRNTDGKTADMVFAEEHEDLKRQTEKWMTKAATGFALMSTGVFTGYIYTDCKLPVDEISPVFVEPWELETIMLFLRVTGLCTSLISVCMFSFIATCSFTEDDHLYYIPKQFCIGLAALISSIWVLALAVITLFISFPGQNIWLLLASCVSIPTALKRLNRHSPRLLFSLAFG